MSLTHLPFELPGSLYRSPMPFGPYDGDNTLWASYQEAEIDVVVVLTESQEYLVYARQDLPRFYRQHGLRVIHLSIPDFHAPEDRGEYQQALDHVEELAKAGKNVVTHCLAGIGRTGTFYACLAQNVLGFSGQKAIRWTRSFIPGALENREQEQFVIEYQAER
jgi:protein-tyrosine phosphatase